MKSTNPYEEIAAAYQSLVREVESKNLNGVLTILSEDILRWYDYVKKTWLEFIDDQDGWASHMFNREQGSPFLPADYVRPFVGEDVAYDLLEFHHSAAFAESFRSRINALHIEIRNFIEPLCAYAARPKESRPLEPVFDLEQHRKDIGVSARELSSYVALIAEQFDVPARVAVKFIGPKPPSEWAKIFGTTWETIKKRINDKKIIAQKLSSKSWRIRAEDIP